MRFWPKLSTGPDELITYYNAIEFIESCKKNNVRKFKSKFPAQQKKLLDLLDKIDEESRKLRELKTDNHNLEKFAREQKLPCWPKEQQTINGYHPLILLPTQSTSTPTKQKHM